VPVAPAVAATAAALLLLYLAAFALGRALLLGCRWLWLLWLSLLRWTLRTRLTLLVRPASFPSIGALLLLAVASLLQPWLLLTVAMLLAAAIALSITTAPVVGALVAPLLLASRRLRGGLHRRWCGRRRRGSRLEQAEEAAEDAHGRFGRRLHDR
jgi:hypothetical protein